MIKSFVLLSLSIFILSSCVSYKIGTVIPESKNVNSNLVFENDTIKINYNFWGKNGLASFDIYNKLNIPIYLDWKKSAFIPNDKMMSYWQDETNTMSSTLYSSYDYWGIFSGKANTKTKSIRQERVGVILPNAMITTKKYSLIPINTTLPIQKFSLSNTPLRFRNYLLVSTSEQFDKNVFYVDNSFFVSSVIKTKESKYKTSKASNTFFIEN